MSSLEAIAAACGFDLIRTEAVAEIDGSAHTMVHRASGARLLFLQNDDPNKAFCISFKTPAADDTGVFHILEHSVLCGSRKFPVKEPFVNLLKSSMQTFLNAMTFPDKTMYPVASTNEQDLMNLMDVYLDAVFHPDIYRKKTIFEQEGWHYELTGAVGADADGETSEAEEAGKASCPLTYNGVVYNEMKGALSDPDSVLYDTLSAALFPQTTYRFESGGTPRSIPNLTYEDFLDTHQRHYRPDNAYITLYGNLDPERFLAFIDGEYLAPWAHEDHGPLSINPLDIQKPVVAPHARTSMVTAPENACCALGYAAGLSTERERLVASDILIDALLGSNEAPLKRALLDAGLASDASAYLADAVAQPFVVIALRGTRTPDALEKLKAVVDAKVAALVHGELDMALVEAALAHGEFVMRENNFGYADGVVYAMSSMAGWLYDDDSALEFIRYEDVFASLREKLSEGYFQNLLKELFLENDHWAGASVDPVEQDPEEAETDRLEAVYEAMGPERLAAVEQDVAALRRAQEAFDAPEDVAKLPRLSVADVGQGPASQPFGSDPESAVPCVVHGVPTHGIGYYAWYLSLDAVAFDELPYVSILAMMLGKLDTEKHSAADIDLLVQAHLGNLGFFAEVHEDIADADRLHPKLVVTASALKEGTETAASLAAEILGSTRFADRAKMRDILVQKKAAMEQAFAANGHGAAAGRAASYCSRAGVAREALGGVDLYRVVARLAADYDNCADELASRLEDLARRLYNASSMTLSLAGDEQQIDAYRRAFAQCAVPSFEVEPILSIPDPIDRREGFIIPSDVSYTALAADRRSIGAPYSGAWLVASRILSYDYLWTEVRVKGGAYGAGFSTTRTGPSRFYSYRDPRIDETVARFKAAGPWLSAFCPDEAEMEGYVVAAVASMDAPLKPRDLIRRQMGMYFAGVTEAMRAETRAGICATVADDVRALGAAVAAMADQMHLCTFSGRDILDRSEEGFEAVDLIMPASVR